MLFQKSVFENYDLFFVGDFENRGSIMQDRIGDRTGDTPTGQDLTNCEAPDEFPTLSRVELYGSSTRECGVDRGDRSSDTFFWGIQRERSLLGYCAQQIM